MRLHSWHRRLPRWLTPRHRCLRRNWRWAIASCELRFDGWVLKRNVDVGTLVGPATNGFTLADTRSVKAVFGVPDTAMANVRLGSAQSVTTEALPGVFQGHITSISAAADPKSRVYSVEVRIDNPRNELKAGMIASITLGGGQAECEGNGGAADRGDSQSGTERGIRSAS